jgi:hypothetical protein
LDIWQFWIFQSVEYRLFGRKNCFQKKSIKSVDTYIIYFYNRKQWTGSVMIFKNQNTFTTEQAFHASIYISIRLFYLLFSFWKLCTGNFSSRSLNLTKLENWYHRQEISFKMGLKMLKTQELPGSLDPAWEFRQPPNPWPNFQFFIKCHFHLWYKYNLLVRVICGKISVW